MIRHLLTNQKHQENIAVIEGDSKLHYIDLLQKVWKIHPLLPQRQQETIGILLPNGGDYIAAFWGTLMTGMIAFPLNVLMSGDEILILLKEASVNIIITTTAYQHIFEETKGFDELSLTFIWMDKLETKTIEHEYATIDIETDKPMLLLNTSGTTGKVKIAQLSEKNIETAVLGYLDKLFFNDADLKHVRYILAVPFSCAYGIMILSACLIHSFPVIVLDNEFTLDSLYRTAEKYKATHYEGSTTTILLMAQMSGRIIPYDIQTLKYFGFGGSYVSGDIIDKLLKAYPNMEFYQGYGMTEAAPLITKHPQCQLTKTHSTGTAINGVEIAVEVKGEILNTPYIKGEILVQGSNVMLGYLDNNSETNQVLKNGYLYTGDIGYLDDDGYLYLCGRKKNIIIIRGFNVYPEEVENCIQNSQLVKDAFVYGIEDDYGNEMICADIIPLHSQVNKEAIILYCNSHLAEYKIPKKISLCTLIQKNPSGKTRRYNDKNVQ